MKKIFKITLINILIIFVFGLILEISLRTFLSFKHSKNPNINYWYKTWYRFHEPSYVEFNDKLNYSPKKIDLKKVDRPRWKRNSRITINKEKFRTNDNNLIFNNDKKILAVGDSYTFGDQVSNNETWPSCLEKNTKIQVDNAGVSGYGTSQAIRRAIIESQKRNYDYLIWSVIFLDFNRDIIYKNLIIEDDNLKFNIFTKDNSFTKNSDELILQDKKIYDYLREYSFTFYLFDRTVIKKITNKFDKKKTIIKPLYSKNNSKNIKVEPEELVNFLINKFKSINISKKFILLQYTDESNNTNESIKIKNNKEVKKYKDILIKEAKMNNINVLDSIEIFSKMTDFEKRKLWLDHHTPKGNLLVCQFLLDKINFD
jgi:hypothetical protein|tara:strand:- start:3252 stop:4364 length:1113 start_codon:yes stop_codon:yes gene_type:complete